MTTPTRTIRARWQQRGRTAAEWTALNEVLLVRERGIELDTGREKLGDGVTRWNDLAYLVIGGGDPTGTAAAAVAAHEAAANPHPVYTTADELAAAIAGKANTADLATVATSGTYNDLSGLPTLGTAAAAATDDFAPAAEGVTGGDSHDHSGGDGAQIAYSSLSGVPAAPTPEELANPAEPAIRSWSPARLWDLVQAWYLGQAPNIFTDPYDPPIQRALNQYLVWVESLQTTWGAINPANFASTGDRRFGGTLQPLGVADNSSQIRGINTSWSVGGVQAFGTIRGRYALTINSTAAFSLEVGDTLGDSNANWEGRILIKTTQVPASFTFTGSDTVIVMPGYSLADNPFAAGGVTMLDLDKRDDTTLTARFWPATVAT